MAMVEDGGEEVRPTERGRRAKRRETLGDLRPSAPLRFDLLHRPVTLSP
jgi:hypothetical protein